jgi:hypothetical protein
LSSVNVARWRAVAAITTAALAATALTACGAGEDLIDGAGPGFLATLVENWEDSFEFETEIELTVDYHSLDADDAIAELRGTHGHAAPRLLDVRDRRRPGAGAELRLRAGIPVRGGWSQRRRQPDRGLG